MVLCSDDVRPFTLPSVSLTVGSVVFDFAVFVGWASRLA
jgi:hypothetical protein